MWEPRLLTTPWASTAFYRDSLIERKIRKFGPVTKLIYQELNHEEVHFNTLALDIRRSCFKPAINFISKSSEIR
jgi:hypothetical protein